MHKDGRKLVIKPDELSNLTTIVMSKLEYGITLERLVSLIEEQDIPCTITMEVKYLSYFTDTINIVSLNLPEELLPSLLLEWNDVRNYSTNELVLEWLNNTITDIHEIYSTVIGISVRLLGGSDEVEGVLKVAIEYPGEY